MDRRKIKFLLLGTGIVATMAVMVAIGFNKPGSMAYYLPVSEYLAAADNGSRNYRVNGKVVAGSIERLPSGQDVRFSMSDGSATLAVQYHGIVPDTFVDRADVVVEGTLQDDGTFNAHTLLAKCPSKYESADGAEHPEEIPIPGEQASVQ